MNRQRKAMAITATLLFGLSIALNGAQTTELFDGRATIVNATGSVLYAVLVRTTFKLGSRHERLHNPADLNQVYIFAILPGCSAVLQNYKRDLGSIDRDLFVSEAFISLQNALQAGTFRGTGIAYFNVGSTTKVFVGEKPGGAYQFFTSKSSAESNLKKQYGYGSIEDLQNAIEKQWTMPELKVKGVLALSGSDPFSALKGKTVNKRTVNLQRRIIR